MIRLLINDHPVTGKGLDRVSYILDLVRGMANINERAEVSSVNNFPAGAGIASSAAAFAALALASSRAAGLTLSEGQLSGWHGAARVRHHAPSPADLSNGRWALATMIVLQFRLRLPNIGRLTDCVAIVNATHKKTGSTEGHALAWTSPLQAGRVADATRRLDICRNAILTKRF